MSGAGIGSESVNKCSLRPLSNLYSESSVRTAGWPAASIGRRAGRPSQV